MSLFNFKKNIDHFKEHCPTEARNYFKEILSKLETIEKRLETNINRLSRSPKLVSGKKTTLKNLQIYVQKTKRNSSKKLTC